MRKIAIAILLVSSAILCAAPARDGQRYYKQPNGTVFSGQSKGDAFFHWIETSDGEIVIYNAKSRQYEKADISSEALKSSGKMFKPSKTRSENRTADSLTEKRKQLHHLWIKKRSSMQLRRFNDQSIKK